MAGVTRWKRRLDSVLSHFVKDVDELDAEVLQVRLGGGGTPALNGAHGLRCWVDYLPQALIIPVGWTFQCPLRPADCGMPAAVGQGASISLRGQSLAFGWQELDG